MKKTSIQPSTGFGSAENKDQDRFDKAQQSLSKDGLKQQTSALVALYRKQQAGSLTK